MALFATIAMRKMQLTQQQNANQWDQMQICRELTDVAAIGAALADGKIEAHELSGMTGVSVFGGNGRGSIIDAAKKNYEAAVTYANTNIDAWQAHYDQFHPRPESFKDDDAKIAFETAREQAREQAIQGLIEQYLKEKEKEISAMIKAEETKLQMKKTQIEIRGKAIDAEMQSLDQGIDKGAKALAPKL